MDNTNELYSIAIDGTAASGKSTVAKLLAETLGCGYLDTGKLYRAVALDLLKGPIVEPQQWSHEVGTVQKQLLTIGLTLSSPPAGECRICLNGVDCNERLSDLEVEKATPFAARLPVVRDYLLDVQRNLAKEQSVVMAGRDIGSVVLPGATLKVFIDADLKERAKRRLSQHQADFSAEELEMAAAVLQQRDYQDATREVAPMVAAPDALILDSTHQTPAQLVQTITSELTKRTKVSYRGIA